jgi:hypothetical protein
MVERNIDLHEALKRSVNEEAARMIAEVLPAGDDLATKAYVDQRIATLTADMHREFSSVKGWMIAMMVPLWLGVYGTLLTLITQR